MLAQSIGAAEYTPTTETTCNNGICNLVQYSGTNFVFEDSEWKPIKEARSLKDKFTVIKSEDINYPVEVIDFNYTSITLDLTVSESELNKDIDLKVYDKINKTKKPTDKNKNVKDKDKKIKLTGLDKHREIIDMSDTTESILGQEIKWGLNSTTITLQDNVTENLNDALISNDGSASSEAHNFNNLGIFFNTVGDLQQRLYLMFSLSSIPSNVNILNASLSLYLYTIESSPYDTSIYEVNSTAWWNEENLTWLNSPCQIDASLTLNQSNCNATSESTNKADIANTFIHWNITAMTKKAYSQNDNNMSMMLAPITSGGSNAQVRYYSKEYMADTSKRPYLNITYSNVIPKIMLNNPINDSTVLFRNMPFNFNFTINDSTDILNATLWWNISNIWRQNVTNQSKITFGDGTNTSLWANLSRGHFIWNIEVCNVNGNCSFADHNWTIQINNTIPNATNISITPLPITAGTSLKGHLNFSDADGDSYGGNQSYWYINGSIVNEANNTRILLGGNVTELSNITFSVRFNDTYDWGKWINSSTATVGDATPPDIKGNSTQGITSFTTSDKVNITVNVTDVIGTVNSVKVIINRTGTSDISNLSMALLGNNLYQYATTYAIDTYKIVSFWAKDGSDNVNIADSTLSFTVTTPSGTTPAGGGGGGAPEIIITNVTEIITGLGCNYNNICESKLGEDWINCKQDCEFNWASIDPFCLIREIPDKPCLWRTKLFFNLTIALFIVSGLILISPTGQGFKIRRFMKKKLNINILREKL